jgi:hypothetical protein
VQIDIAFKRQDIRAMLTRRRSNWGSVFSHFNPFIVTALPIARIE